MRNHITSIFAKLGVSSRSQAIVMAKEAGCERRRSLTHSVADVVYRCGSRCGRLPAGHLSRAGACKLGPRPHDRHGAIPHRAP